MRGSLFETVYRKFIVANYLKYCHAELEHTLHCFEDLKRLQINPCFNTFWSISRKPLSTKALIREIYRAAKIAKILIMWRRLLGTERRSNHINQPLTVSFYNRLPWVTFSGSPSVADCTVANCVEKALSKKARIFQFLHADR